MKPLLTAAILLALLCVGGVLCAVASDRTLPRPDLEGCLYRTEGFQFKKLGFDEGTRVVVVFYSASWCAYCRQIATPLKEVYPSLRERYPAMEFVTYSMDDSVSGRAEHLRDACYPWLAIGPAAAKKEAWQLQVEGGIPAFQAFAVEEECMRPISPVGPADAVLECVDTYLKEST